MNPKTMLTAACATALLSLHAHAQTQQPPNIVVVFLDDMGYGDLTVTGATGYDTPNIDRLCAEGMRFTNFHVPQPICTASRAALMTGCYPNRIGLGGVALGPQAKTGIAQTEDTIADILKRKNYTCGAFGKWHLGHHPQFLPTRHGFDEYYGLPYSNDMWPHHPNAKAGYPDLPFIEGDSNGDRVLNPKVTPQDQTQLTTQYTQRAKQFIEKNKNNPFFVYLAHSMPHVPLYASDKFKGKSAQGTYGDVMMEIDWSVGEIINTLEKLGLEKNTLFIFTSDNGPWLNYGNHAGSTGGLREGKGTVFEGGTRVPCIMRWPGKIPAGKICNQLASTIDLLPTFAHVTGAPPPALRIDGVNIITLMTGEETVTSPRKHLLYYYRQNNLEAVSDGRFKLVFPHEGRTYEEHLPGNDGKPGQVNERRPFDLALYDLRRDPGERYDVKELYPETIAALMKIADEARQDLGDSLTGAKGPGRRPPGQLHE